jgi:hypothetical protein
MGGVQVMTANYTISLNQNNDEVVQLTFTEADPSDSGTPFNLTGLEVEFFIKPTKTTADTASGVVKLTSTSGAITITNATGGVCQVSIPAADIATSGALWWRADVVNTGDVAPRKTAGYGNLNILPM